MIVRMLNTFLESHEASDNLHASRAQPFFIFGYVYRAPSGSFDVVTLWDASEGPLVRGQREVLEYVVGDRFGPRGRDQLR